MTLPVVLDRAVRARLRISDEIFGGLVAILDACTVAGCATIAYFLYLKLIVAEPSAQPEHYVLVVTVATAVLLQRLTSRRAYVISDLRNTQLQIKRVFGAWSTAIVVLVFAIFLLKSADSISRVWLMSWYAGTALGLVASRCAIGSMLDRWGKDGYFFRSAVVIGANALGRRFIETRMEDPTLGLRVIGLFDDRTGRVPSQIGDVPVLGRVADLPAFARRCQVDHVIIAMPLSAEQRILEIVSKLRALDVDVSVLGDAIAFAVREHSVSYPAGVPAFDLMKRPIAGWHSVAKRAMDISLSLLALILLSPLLAALAIAVKLDSPGPALFRQKRLGFNGRAFYIYKFRSMRADHTDAHAEVLVTKGDSRVTRVGSFLRRTSLDELPQLWNVLIGDMSLVGPRPHALKAKAANRLYDEVVAEYAVRHRVKPGITGWAQVKGWRGETDTIEKIKKRVEHDLYYIDNWSLSFDLRILLMTALGGFTGRNAF